MPAPPLAMPATGASLQSFEIERVDYSAPEAGGALGGVQAGFPLWLGEWTIGGRIGVARSDEWRAFLPRLRGQQRPFWGWDLRRPYPKAHIGGFTGMTIAGGSDPFTGACADWSETITTALDSEIELEGLPAGLILSKGDYIGLKWDAAGESAGTFNRRTMVRVAIGATADGEGKIKVTSEPPVPTLVPSGAVAYLDQPRIAMRQMLDRTGLDPVDRTGGIRGGRLVGLQDLRP